MKIVLTANAIERVFSQCAVCFLPEDTRPLRGGIGVVDWALNGLITRLIRDGRVGGQFLESVLMRPDRLLACEKLLIIGMGPVSSCRAERVQKLGKKLHHTLVHLRVQDISLSLSMNGEGLTPEFVAENLTMGFLSEMAPEELDNQIEREMTLAISCGTEEIDEILLGIQKAKVALKRHFNVLVLESA